MSLRGRMGSTNFPWLVLGIKPEYPVRYQSLLDFFEWEVLEEMKLQNFSVSYRKTNELMEIYFITVHSKNFLTQ